MQFNSLSQMPLTTTHVKKTTLQYPGVPFPSFPPEKGNHWPDFYVNCLVSSFSAQHFVRRVYPAAASAMFRALESQGESTLHIHYLF